MVEWHKMEIRVYASSEKFSRVNIWIHQSSIVPQGGIAACLMYLDFFSISAQRAALAVTANCCQNMNSDEFQYIRESLALLSGRLGQQV